MQPTTYTKRRSRRPCYFLLAVPAVLLIPLVAMQFTTEVNWGALDFLVMGVLLTVLLLTLNLVIRRYRRPGQRLFLVVLCVGAFLLLWAELAVGIFGTWFAGS